MSGRHAPVRTLAAGYESVLAKNSQAQAHSRLFQQQFLDQLEGLQRLAQNMAAMTFWQTGARIAANERGCARRVRFLKDDPGRSAVRQLIPTSVISAINPAEVATTLIHGGMPADEVEVALRELPIRIAPSDEDQAYHASALRPRTADKGLSLGDRCCLARAHCFGLPALTCDRAWGGLPPDIGVEVQLVR